MPMGLVKVYGQPEYGPQCLRIGRRHLDNLNWFPMPMDLVKAYRQPELKFLCAHRGRFDVVVLRLFDIGYDEVDFDV